MKKILITLGLLAALSAGAQIQFIDLTTRTTNTVTGGAQITISNVCPPSLYTLTNTQNIVVGDPIPTAFGKINSDFNYLSNQLVQTLNLPNQINTNLNAYIILESNRVNAVALTNATLSGGLDGVRYAITNFLGTNMVTADFYNFMATNVPGGGGGYPDIYDNGSGEVGINNTSPNYTLSISTVGSYPTVSLQNLTDNWTPMDFYDYLNDQVGGFGYSGVANGDWLYMYTINKNFYITSINNEAYGLGMDGSTGNAMFQNVNLGIGNVFTPGGTMPSYNLDVTGTCGDSVDGGWNIDSSGNITCLSLTQTSDENAKTNIVAVNPATILQKLVSIPVYRWNFKDFTRTNLVVSQTTNGLPRWKKNVTNGKTNLVNLAQSSTKTLLTNVVIRTHVVSGETHFGPMAQDWAAQIGGHTNKISVIDMQGLLLAGVQALADPTRVQAMPFLKLSGYTVTHSTNSTFGYGTGLVACDANFIYVSTGTNAWRRVALATGSW